MDEGVEGRRARRWLLGFAAAALLAQLLVVHDSFYLATDDYLIMTWGRAEATPERLFARQSQGTPAIRPVSLLLSRAEYLVAGESATARLVVNACLHALAGWMLFLFLEGLFGRPRRAAIAAAAFLAWPLHGEGLAWPHSGHTSILVGLLTLAALASFARRWSPPIGVGLLTLALLTRENAVAAGPILLAIAWWRTRSLPEALRRILPYAIVLVTYVGVRGWQVLTALDTGADLPVGQSPARTVAYLTFHLFGPVHPAIAGAWPLLIVAFAGLLAAVAFAGPRRPALLWIVVFCLPFAPLYDTGDPLFEATSAAYERRWYHLYLPAAGMAWLVASAVSRRVALAPVALVALLGLQLGNAAWYADLGSTLRRTFTQLEQVVAQGRPVALEIPEQTLLGGLVEHQVLDVPRVFDGTGEQPRFTAPVYRLKHDGEGEYVRAVRDPYGYPWWQNLPKGFQLPEDTLRVRWDEPAEELRLE